MANNPILSMINSNNPLALISALRSGNPEALYGQLMKSNPNFAQFVQQNQGKTPEQICQAYGVDPGLISQFMK